MKRQGSEEPLLTELERLACCRNIVLLQGPVGPFFSRLAVWLRGKGVRVHKFNFNGGDARFYSDSLPDTYTYRGRLEDFSREFSYFLQFEKADAVVCFGDTRPYHKIAKDLCASFGVSFWVFEEGYFRPDWVTLEEHGVNAFSQLPRDAAFFQTAQRRLRYPDHFDQQSVRKGFWPTAWCAARYYVAMFWARKRYPHYIHHRSSDIFYYVKSWLRAGWRKYWYALVEAGIARRSRAGRLGRFFIFPLQVATDSQIRVHSNYGSVADALEDVLASFCIHAPEDVKLVVKHHPMDRGFTGYRRKIECFVQEHPQMRGRVEYVHDISLPDLLRHGMGMVTVNSTSGLSALIHNMPVKVLGRANYDIPGIASQQSLRDFWKQPQPPEPDKFHAYRMYHLNQTQINGNFYTDVILPD